MHKLTFHYEQNEVLAEISDLGAVISTLAMLVTIN